jgi:uncharacterized protein YabE (DUF348 family)/3D (Asp-Asp-Asp) domain-containing protein
LKPPAGPARFLKTRYIVAASVAALVALSSITGFAWANKTVTLVVDGSSKSLTTESTDVASLLKEGDVSLRQGDLVSPDVSSAIGDGSVVVVRHAIPVTVKIGDQSMTLTVLGRTVADALVMAGLDPTSGLSSDPTVDSPLEAGMTITATDVFYRIAEEEIALPYGSVVQGDPALPLNARKVLKPGVAGSAIRVWQVLVTSGVEGARTLKAEQVLKPAVNEIVAVGMKRPFRKVIAAKAPSKPRVTVKPRRTPAPAVVGKTLKMDSTAYTPYECGQDVSWVAAKKRAYHIPDGWGLIAVDPRVIPLGSKVFVAGYGYAVACDTGGAIKGNIIDVCYWGGDLNAPVGKSTPSMRQAAHNRVDSWGRRHGVRVTILGK